jgi:alpha-tubulin suppressor-like RCC1 family protein
VDIVLPSGVSLSSVSAGERHSCALTRAGTAYCWGYNLFGQLGDGTTTTGLIPTRVAGGLSFSILAVGGAHACALTAAGAAHCWGLNRYGQLGEGTTTNRDTPLGVAMPAGVVFPGLSAGYEHTCGLTPSGEAYCWGWNLYGQLGDGTTTNRLSPTPVAQ